MPDTGPRTPGAGGSWGDPHLITFDGGSVDFQAAGDYTLVESTTDNFAVQARYVRRPGLTPTISINHGVAARVGTSIIAFGDSPTAQLRDPLVATLDGQPLALGGPTELPGGAVLTYDNVRGAVVRWPDGTQLAAGRWTGDNVFVTLSASRWGRVHGILGNADRDPANDTTARDGTLVEDVYDAERFYGVFGASWHATGDASFFRTPLPPDRGLPVVPPDPASVAALPADLRAAAEQICRDRGLTPGAGLDQCILDVALTGDNGFADNAAVVAQLTRTTVPAGALGAPVEDTVLIGLGQRATGSLDRAFAADVYEIDLAAGSNVRITTPGPCPGVGTFSITLINPSGEPIGRTRGTGCGTMEATQLRESGRYQLRVFDSGGFTGAYELQVDGDQLGLTCQATEVAPNDDGSSPPIALPFTVDFLGQRFSNVWVNNNGNVTFNGPQSAYTPSPFASGGNAIIAAWWADVDTRGAASQPVRYGLGNVDGRQAFCVDFHQVGYFASHDDKLNSFQLYLVDRSDVADGAFDIVLRYRQLLWETGDASGGSNGLGGTSAAVGYANGTGQPGTFHEVTGSRTPGSFLDTAPTALTRTSTNSDEAGIHIFHIRG
ncbi:nidogen-like domain-containing protein [Phytohabitans flavus]|uniref:nidogen-like domain-containing protein n=1 Tax=Phytohabitans flavus TaxID=1076124 RepID=UPI00363978B0